MPAWTDAGLIATIACDMDKTFDPKKAEQAIYEAWLQAGYFKHGDQGSPYCIMLPPPNVTGTLHMGHGFQQTLMDILIRFHRMQGDNTLWQAGTDHAGIATQMVVERRLLREQKKSRHDLGREKFIEHVWEWKKTSDDNIKRQMRRLGTSMDWQRARFTMDESISKAVKEAFIQLYDEGLIYRGKRLVNWDPVLLTAVSDLEVVSQEEQGSLWHIRYPLADGKNHVAVATTRPETLLGDTAIAVHPDDKRYKHLIGKQVQLPLTDRTIPIIADDYVDPEFGSGCVKITPAHDFNDYTMGQRHDLPMINVLTPDACINENAPKAYRHMDRFEARKKIVADLETQGLLEKTEKHTLKVPRGDRSNAVIEPYLTDQWFVKAKSLAEPAIEAVKKGDIKFVPENWSKTYFQWLENIEDWCISRQLWWGHRIPAWYDEEGNVYVAHDEKEVRKKYNLGDKALNQDHDVLDTWFSSGLWPFATLGWPEKTVELDTFYPTSVLVTGFDIIFFWVARMVMMGLKFTGKVPFSEVYIHGLIRDAEGQKMSKSKGNVLDPIDLTDGIELEPLVEKRTSALMQPKMAEKIAKRTRKEFPNGIQAFGTDAVRFTFCALASTGRDINFDLNRTEGYRNFCNKIWNAARYVMMNTESNDLSGKIEYSLADKWIRSRLQQTIKTVHDSFKNYRFDLIAQAIYEFTWNEYCDWYLELSKADISNTGTRKTLLEVLEAILRLTHPIMPFITETIWQRVAPLLNISGDTIMLQRYPQFNDKEVNLHAGEEIDWLKKVIVAIRTIRSEMNISPAKTIPLLLHKGENADQQRIDDTLPFLKLLAKLDSVQWSENAPPPSATALIGKLELHIPLADLIDKNAESTRLNKEIERLLKDISRTESKLSNASFIEKAPTTVVEKERGKLSANKGNIAKLKKQLERINSL